MIVSASPRLWQRIGRSAALIALTVVAITIVFVVVSAIGVRIVGDAAAWQRWLHAHVGMFVAWRLILYAAIARGWWWMHTRLRTRDDSREAQRRLRRAEIGAVCAIALIEVAAQLHPL